MKGRKRSLRAMEGEPAGARSMSRKQAEGEPRSWPAPRRSARLMRMKELAGASEEVRILKLKKELKDLENLRREVNRRWNWPPNFIVSPDGKKSLPTDSEDEAVEEAAGKRKNKVVVAEEVPQALIEYYILNPPCNPEYTEYMLRKRPQGFREFYVVEKAAIQKMWEYEQAIVHQFRTKGYAVDYSEVEVEVEEN